MKIKLIQFTFLLTFTQLTQAAAAPESYTGKYKVGECSISNAENATITFNGESLFVKFSDGTPVADVYVQSTDFDYAIVKVTEESFTLTNEYLAKINEGMYLPIMRVKLTRSEAGNRVHFSTLHYETNMTSECDFYRE